MVPRIQALGCILLSWGILLKQMRNWLLTGFGGGKPFGKRMPIKKKIYGWKWIIEFSLGECTKDKLDRVR